MPKHRLFVAVNLPEATRRTLLKTTEKLRDLPVRWTKLEDLHITLVFLGQTNDEVTGRVASILPLAVNELEPFEITLQHVALGPSPGKPRMIWATGARSLELATLRSTVVKILEREASPIRHTRDTAELFCPHVTLGRLKLPEWQKLPAKPQVAESLDLALPVTSIELMQSELGQAGPRYTVLLSAVLNGRSDHFGPEPQRGASEEPFRL